ncbi:hypothetical protein [Saccharothrix syringae]|uniref:PLL-like beta propeller domain-containing protein n=1 Tax=Saccharothrix syringae TaxID=103733 RepID=A0A5Q0GUI4_SACSY|nr:hypothetical protein [Saccharothrix syringae]QFZ17032.1 hypothetical protein EKG83_05710 [Saccharothrix syringae]
MPKRSGAGLLAVAAAVLAMVVAPNAPAAHADAAGGGGDYVQLNNDAEVLDTRDGTGAAAGQRGAESTTVFPVLGVGGVPTTGVGSVLVRASVLDPTADTWLVLTPDGEQRSDTTAVTAQAGESLSAFVAVQVGANGKVAAYQAAGKAHLVVEVHGYFKSSQGTSGGGYVPVAHTRTVDTRSGLGTATGTVPAGGSRTVTLTGGLVPAGSPAAYVNLATLGATEPGWLSYAPVGGTARPVMNYAKGTTQQAAVVQLPADGKVTFTNRGPAAVHFMLNLEGHFTASATTGSGYREVNRRLLNTRTVGAGLPVAPNSTVDVQVGGTHGLPTRGIAAALLSITTTSEESGYVKAWPVGQAEPGLTVMDHGVGRRTNSVSVKPGTDGKVRIRNGSSGTSHVIVDLQGWFAEPLPVVPVVPDTATTAFQAAPVAGARVGTLEYAYTDNAGRVVHGHQGDVDNFGAIQWTVVSGNEAFTGRPAITQLSDGRVQITAQHRDGDIRAITQTAAGAVTWGAWKDLGGSMAAAPSAARQADGTPVQFAVDADGRLWVYQQKGAVPYWRNLGDQDLVGGLTAVAVQGGLRVFGLDGSGAVRTVLFYDDGSLSPWTNLGGAGASGVPAVVVRPGYQLQVFVRGAAGTVVTKLQDAAGTWPADWTELGGVAAAGAPSAVLDPALGRVAVVVRGTDREIHRVWETAVGANTWGEWGLMIDGISDPSATDPTTLPFANANGQSWLVSFLSPNGTPRFVQRYV